MKKGVNLFDKNKRKYRITKTLLPHVAANLKKLVEEEPAYSQDLEKFAIDVGLKPDTGGLRIVRDWLAGKIMFSDDDIENFAKLLHVSTQYILRPPYEAQLSYLQFVEAENSKGLLKPSASQGASQNEPEPQQTGTLYEIPIAQTDTHFQIIFPSGTRVEFTRIAEDGSTSA